MNGELHVALDTTDFLAVFPLKGDGHARLVGTVREEVEHQHENLSWDDVSRRVIEWMRIDVAHVNWFSTYRVHHRVADHFRKGRAFSARRRRAHPQPRRRTGHEHRHRRRREPRLEARRRPARACGRVAARQLRAGAHRLRPAPGRDDRSGVHGRDEPRRSLACCGFASCRVLFPASLEVVDAAPARFRTVSQTAVNYRGQRAERGACEARCKAGIGCHG